jgi:hypothetical protein
VAAVAEFLVQVLLPLEQLAEQEASVAVEAVE